MSSLKNKAIIGTIWSTIDRVSVQGINFILSLIIARLLDPSDYGIIAMTTLFITLSNTFVDSGFANALVRKYDRTETDNSTVFYFNIVVGIVTYFLIWILSPYIANFYNMPLLSKVLRVAALTIPFYSFSIVQQAILTSNIDFKSQAKISVISALFSGIIGVILAYNGAGVWSLATQMVLASFLRMVLLWCYIKWVPTESFSRASFKDLFSFGSKLLLANIIVAVGNNVTSLILGKKFSSEQLGYYNRAEQIGYFPATNLTAILQRVTFPVFSKIQNDTETLRNNYLKVCDLTALLTFFTMGLLFVIAGPMIITFLTDKWESSVRLLRILIIGISWWPFFALNINLLQVIGLSKYVLIIECLKATINITAIFITLHWGVTAVCIALSITSFINSFIYCYFTKKVFAISWLNQFKIMIPYIIIATIAGGLSSAIMEISDNQWIKLICASVLYVGIYGIAITIYNKTMIKSILAAVKTVRHK